MLKCLVCLTVSGWAAARLLQNSVVHYVSSACSLAAATGQMQCSWKLLSPSALGVSFEPQMVSVLEEFGKADRQGSCESRRWEPKLLPGTRSARGSPRTSRSSHGGEVNMEISRRATLKA